MRKILKRVLSSILIMAMIVMTVPINVMASSEESRSSTKLLIDGQEILYDISETTEKRTVSFEENGVKHIAEFNKISNEIFFDGEKIGDFQNSGITTYTLREFNRYEGNLGNLTGSVAAVAAVILSIAGFPGIGAALELANIILGQGYKNVWYRVIEYYDDDFSGSRPNIIRKFYFYSDANYRHLIWSS